MNRWKVEPTAGPTSPPEAIRAAIAELERARAAAPDDPELAEAVAYWLDRAAKWLDDRWTTIWVVVDGERVWLRLAGTTDNGIFAETEFEIEPGQSFGSISYAYLRELGSGEHDVHWEADES